MWESIEVQELASGVEIPVAFISLFILRMRAPLARRARVLMTKTRLPFVP
jgi:hypothetical protein